MPSPIARRAVQRLRQCCTTPFSRTTYSSALPSRVVDRRSWLCIVIWRRTDGVHHHFQQPLLVPPRLIGDNRAAARPEKCHSLRRACKSETFCGVPPAIGTPSERWMLVEEIDPTHIREHRGILPKSRWLVFSDFWPAASLLQTLTSLVSGLYRMYTTRPSRHACSKVLGRPGSVPKIAWAPVSGSMACSAIVFVRDQAFRPASRPD